MRRARTCHLQGSGQQHGRRHWRPHQSWRGSDRARSARPALSGAERAACQGSEFWFALDLPRVRAGAASLAAQPASRVNTGMRTFSPFQRVRSIGASGPDRDSASSTPTEATRDQLQAAQRLPTPLPQPMQGSKPVRQSELDACNDALRVAALNEDLAHEPLRPPPVQVDVPPDLSAIRVALAEDLTINQRVLSRLLLRVGVSRVDIANNGQEALDLLGVVLQPGGTPKVIPGRPTYDVVLMDLNMPVMDGPSLAAARRSRAHLTDSP
jgi:CheY-like chemotaxis protein